MCGCWDVGGMGCVGAGMLEGWDVWVLGCRSVGICGRWDAGVVGYVGVLGCRSVGMREYLDVRVPVHKEPTVG